MKKPTPKKKKPIHDYLECRDYLQNKYGYDERDYAGSLKGKYDSSKPYLDFWHWVIDHHEIHNGCDITFSTDDLNEIEESWVKEIYQRYIDEFADKDGILELHVWW